MRDDTDHDDDQNLPLCAPDARETPKGEIELMQRRISEVIDRQLTVMIARGYDPNCVIGSILEEVIEAVMIPLAIAEKLGGYTPMNCAPVVAFQVAMIAQQFREDHARLQQIIDVTTPGRERIRIAEMAGVAPEDVRGVH